MANLVLMYLHRLEAALTLRTPLTPKFYFKGKIPSLPSECLPSLPIHFTYF